MAKIVLIGVGSVCFGIGTLGDLMYYKDVLAGSTIGLVDIEAEKLSLMRNVADIMNRGAGMPYTIEADLDRRQILTGADFVITSPAIKREELWEKDWEIINGAGIKQTYGENGGPGCLSHTLRNVPLMLSIFRDVERLAPNAWVINFTNPEARICMALDRCTKLKFVGLCHQIYDSYRTVSKVLNIPLDDIDIKASGINHFTWVHDIRRKSDGKPIYDQFRIAIGKMPADFEPLSRRLMDTFGLFPSAGDHHLAEYLSYGWEFIGLQGRDFVARREEKAALIRWLRDVSQSKASISERVKGRSGESVIDIIAAMQKGTNGYEVSMDLRNDGCIPNLPDDAIVEVPGVASGDTVRGLRMAPLPEGIAAMMRQQISIHGLSVEAAVKGDRKLALQALLTDPVVDSCSVAEKVLNELLEAHREYVSPNFFL
jgi:alpha-galactosidase